MIPRYGIFLKNMERKEYIQIPRYFDSKKFYGYFILEKLNAMQDKKIESIIFDFSCARMIDPLVIPNFLLLGKLIKEKFGEKPKIYLPDTLEGGYIKNYLFQIGFLKYASRYDLFDFVNNQYGGMEGKPIDPLCRTVYFDGSRQFSSNDIIRGRIERKIQPFADKYLKKFEHLVIDEEGRGEYKNDVVEIIYEMNKNCLEYSGSASFTTFHSRYKDRTINIAISDVGRGFKDSFIDKRNDPMKYVKYDDYQISLLEENCNSESEAIIKGINWQRDSKVYGLYAVIKEVLDYHGWVRIHSNDTMVILTEEYLHDLCSNSLLQNKLFVAENVKKTVSFDGVHIEIVIPLQGGNNIDIHGYR